MSDEEHMEEEEEEWEENLESEIEAEVEDEPFSMSSDDEGRPMSQKEVSFEVLPGSEVINQSQKQIREIMQVCAIPSVSAATLLLRRFKWNKDKLIEAYLENPKKVVLESGMSSLELEAPPLKPNQQVSCLICLEDLPASQTFALSCGHRYCQDCWRGYLDVQIKDGPNCVYATCPSPNCQAMVHESAFKRLVTPASFEKYNKYLIRSFVEDNERIKWCPAPGCENAVRCESLRPQPVTCKCGFSFCFKCADYEIGDHSPVSCSDLEKWLQKASDESENVNWLLANTKKCPKCRSPIEKNGGCMHMTCRIASCGFEFCWMCRGPWSEHGTESGGYYQCNKYDASDAKKEDESVSDVKTDLETYMFYYHRYESHRNAGKIAHKQRQDTLLREEEILNRFMIRSQDTKFLSEATEQLILNRRVLQYSYVMGFYLDRSKVAEKNLFEYLQEDLEKHTNTLSTLYEESLEGKDYKRFMEWKEQITNYTRVTKKFLENFLGGTSNGLVVNK